MSWFPAIATTWRPSSRSASRVRITSPWARGAGCGAVEQVPGDQDDVGVMIARGGHDAAERGGVLVMAVPALEDLADMPVGGMQNLHAITSRVIHRTGYPTGAGLSPEWRSPLSQALTACQDQQWGNAPKGGRVLHGNLELHGNLGWPGTSRLAVGAARPLARAAAAVKDRCRKPGAAAARTAAGHHRRPGSWRTDRQAPRARGRGRPTVPSRSGGSPTRGTGNRRRAAPGCRAVR